VARRDTPKDSKPRGKSNRGNLKEIPFIFVPPFKMRHLGSDQAQDASPDWPLSPSDSHGVGGFDMVRLATRVSFSSVRFFPNESRG
jgi:hypothetical protein